MKKFLVILCFFVSFSVQAAKTIKIGLASNFSEVSTGSSNPYGGYFKGGVTLAIHDSAERLRKNGIQIDLQQFDYGTSDAKTLSAVRNAVHSDVIAVIGYNYSSNALIAAPVHHAEKLPMLTPSASANRLGTIGKYVHLGSYDNQFMAEVLADVASRRLNAKKVAVVAASDCAYCTDLATAFVKEFVRKNGKVVFNKGILSDDKDFGSIIEGIKATHPDIVLVPNQELTSARVVAALSKAGIKTSFLGADGWGTEGHEFFQVLKGVPFSGYSISHWHHDLKDARSEKFVKEYQSASGNLPNDTAVLAYDSTLLLIESLIRAKSLTREELEKSLASIRQFDGVTGKFIYQPNRAPKKSLVLLKVDKDRFSIVEQIHPTVGDRP